MSNVFHTCTLLKKEKKLTQKPATRNKSKTFYILLIHFVRLVTFQLLKALHRDGGEAKSSLICCYQTVGRPAKFWSLKAVRFEKHNLWVMVQIFHLNAPCIFRILCETASNWRKPKPNRGDTETEGGLAGHWLCWGKNKGLAKSICYLLNFVLCVCVCVLRKGDTERGKNSSSLLDFKQSFCPVYLIADGVWRELGISECYFTQ